jgi:hypothetical protein
MLRRTLVLLALAGCGSGNGDNPADGGGPGPDAADPVISGEHPRIYLNHEPTRTRLAAALAANSPAATRFRTFVDNGFEEAQTVFNYALIGALTGETSYCVQAVTMADAYVTADEVLIAAGELPRIAGDSYLEIGDALGDIMLAYDWCFDHLTDAQRTRWLAYGAQAIWNVWHHEQAFWGDTPHPWTGWSVNNPSNNYYSSFLRATLLFGLAAHGEHPDAAALVDFVRDDKIGAQMVVTFDRDLQGGGSREGTGYGTAFRRVFELYDLWETSTGEPLWNLTGHTRASLFHFLHLWVPTLERLAPTGDHARDSSAAFHDYHRHYLLVLAHLIARDEPLAGIAVTQLAASPLPQMDRPASYMNDFLYEHVATDVAGVSPSVLYPAYHASGTGQIYARSSWETDATWIHFIAGPYTESHAHQDQGAFLYFKDEWLAFDPNTLSRSGLHQEPEAHNLVRIVSNGATVEQRVERDPAVLTALHVTDEYAYMAADITPIYAGDPAITRIQRELVYVRPDTLVVFDRADTADGTSRIWQLSSPIQPVISGTTARMGSLRVDRVLPAGAYAVLDWNDLDPDLPPEEEEFTGGWRLDSTDAAGGGRFLHVLGQDSEITSVVASDSGTQLGVTITLTGGATITVRFEDDAPGATLQLGAAPPITLSAGVDALPILAP